MQADRRPAGSPGEADAGAPADGDPGDLLRTPLQAARGTLDLILCGEAGPLGTSLLLQLAALGEALDQLETAIERALPGAPRRDG